jgi:hypothetical protein
MLLRVPDFLNGIPTPSERSSPHLRRSQSEHLRPAANVSHRAHPTSSPSACSEDRSFLGNQQTETYTQTVEKSGETEPAWIS